MDFSWVMRHELYATRKDTAETHTYLTSPNSLSFKTLVLLLVMKGKEMKQNWPAPHHTHKKNPLPGLCPGGVREHRALPGDVQSLSTTLEMKPGLESAPAYSYVFSESCGQ